MSEAPGELPAPVPRALTVVDISLTHWRNHARSEIEPHPAFNVIHGDNAQGKTNLLEAVYLASRLRSFRDGRLSDLVSHGEDAGRVSARVDRAGVTQRVEVVIENGRRRVRVDGKAIRRVGDHCQHYKVVLFTPEDIYLLRGAPSERRRFLDRALFNLEPAFLADSQEYQRALKRRNALLKRSTAGRAALEASLAAYDTILSDAGARIACRRQALVESLSGQIGHVWSRVFGQGAVATIAYRSTLPGVGDGLSAEAVAESYRELLRDTLDRDLARQSTGKGPHLDDFDTLLDGRSVKEHASQGQHRVFVLALKITEIQLVVRRTGVRPILLLDDISSELDRTRNAQLFEYLDEIRGQVFLTTTTPELVGLSVERSEFLVQQGKVCRSS